MRLASLPKTSRARNHSGRVLLSTLAASGLLMAVPTWAQGATFTPPAQLAGAFKSICLDHLGNQAEQAMAAQGAPWHMAKIDSEASAGQANYFAPPFQLSLANNDGFSTCMLTAAADPSLSLEGVAAQVLPPLGVARDRVQLGADSLMWPDAAGNAYVYGQNSYPEVTTGTLAVAVPAEAEKQ